MKEGTKLYSVAHLKCPKCQQGNLFSVPDSYHLGKVLDMPDKCPVCEQDFVKEPGFYSGALWISYPIVMGIMGLSGGLLFFFSQTSVLPGYGRGYFNTTYNATGNYALQPCYMD